RLADPCFAAMAAATALTRGSTAMLSSSATSFLSPDMSGSLGRQFDERQWLRRSKVDRKTWLGTEGLAVENEMGALSVDRHFIHFLEVDSAHLLALVATGDSGSERA